MNSLLQLHRRAQKHLRAFINHRYTDLVVGIMIVLSIFCLLVEFTEAFKPHPIFHFGRISDAFTMIFILELSIRFYAARSKRRFFRKYWLDILAVLPVIRPLRGFRVLRLFRLFRAGKLLSRSLSLFRLVFIKGRGETLVILSIIFILVVASGVGVHLYEPDHEEFRSVSRSLWWSLLSLIAGEPIGATPETAFGKILMIVVMLGGLTVFAMFTGLVSAVMVKRITSEMEVKRMEIEDLNDHILICGWNRMGPMLLDEFCRDSNMSQRPVVIVAQFEGLDILEQAGDHRDRVYPLEGDPTRIEVLKEAGAKRAGYAVLLADNLQARADQDRDARTLLVALTLEKLNPGIYTVAELLSSESTEHLKLAGIEEVINRCELGSKMVATSIRARGLMSMVEEVFTSKYGCQFYKVDMPEKMAGKTFAETAALLKSDYDAILVGIQSGTDQDQPVRTNPPKETLLQSGDRLVIIAENLPRF